MIPPHRERAAFALENLHDVMGSTINILMINRDDIPDVDQWIVDQWIDDLEADMEVIAEWTDALRDNTNN
jgi:hypothetical protein